MRKAIHSNYKLKKAVNSLFFKKKNVEPPSRKYLMHEIKNIILTNKQLNHRLMDFNFNKEYKQMHRTMTKFNNEQNDKKNLASKLSKENEFFTKSYSNIIASLTIKLDNKNINYQTISNFNQKYEPSMGILKQEKDKNFFYEDPLLLTKSKDLHNFYVNENHVNAKKDESLNYSKRLLLGLNSNSPLNRVLQIIDKKKHNFHEEEILGNKENLTERNNIKNININNINVEEQPLSERKQIYFRNKKNLYYNKYTDTHRMNEVAEIILLKKYNKSIKKMLNKNNPERTYTEKNLNRKYFSSILNNNSKNEANKDEIILKNIKSNDIENNKRVVFINSLSSSKNIRRKIHNNADDIKSKKKNLPKFDENKSDNGLKEFEMIFPMQNKLHRSLKKKLVKMKKLKGSIQIQTIYKDLAKTKETVYDYEKEKEPKFKYLYSIFSNKRFGPFQKEEKANIRIKKLDRDLFWTVNKFHNN